MQSEQSIQEKLELEMAKAKKTAKKVVEEFSQTEDKFLESMKTAYEMIQSYTRSPHNKTLPAATQRLSKCLNTLLVSGKLFSELLKKGVNTPELHQEQSEKHQGELNEIFGEHAANIIRASREYLGCLEEMEVNKELGGAFSAFLTENKDPTSPISYFIMPVQRVMRYKLLIVELARQGDPTSLLFVPSLEETEKWANEANTTQRIIDLETALKKLKAINTKSIRTQFVQGIQFATGNTQDIKEKIEILNNAHKELRCAQLSNYLNLANKVLINETGFSDLSIITHLIPIERDSILDIDKKLLETMRSTYQTILNDAFSLATTIQSLVAIKHPKDISLHTTKISGVNKAIERANKAAQEAVYLAKNVEKHNAYHKAFKDRIGTELNFINQKINQLYISAKAHQYDQHEEQLKVIVQNLKSFAPSSSDFADSSARLSELFASPDFEIKSLDQLKEEYDFKGLENSISAYSELRVKRIDALKKGVHKALPDFKFKKTPPPPPPLLPTSPTRHAETARATTATAHAAEEKKLSEERALLILQNSAERIQEIRAMLTQWMGTHSHDTFDCENIMAALFTLESFYKGATPPTEENFLELNAQVLTETAPEVLPLFQVLYDKYLSDKDLAAIARKLNTYPFTVSELEPFADYTRKKDIDAHRKEKKDDGKQEKSEYTDFYTSNIGGRKYFIKKSKMFQSDDISEYFVSMLLNHAIGDRAVPYMTVPTKKDPAIIYLASEVVDGFQTLKQKCAQALPHMRLGADLITDANKEAVINILTPAQRKDVATFLAGSLWVNNTDCQIGNILVDNAGLKAKGFDFGWALADICKPEQAQVKLFESIAPMNLKPVGMHPAGNCVPTNHFNDYPDILNSQDFVDALEEILPKIMGEQIKHEIEAAINKVTREYKNIGERKTLSLFAKHIGVLPLDQEFQEDAQLPDIKQKVIAHLTAKLQQRAHSMAVLKCMLQMKLTLNTKPSDPDKLAKTLQELQWVLYNNFDVRHTPVKAMIPPYSSSFDALLKSSKTMLQNQKQKDTCKEMIAFCELLEKQLGDNPQIIDWESKQQQYKNKQKEATRPQLSPKSTVVDAPATPPPLNLHFHVLTEEETKVHADVSLDSMKERFATACARAEEAVSVAEAASMQARQATERALQATEAIRITVNKILPAGQKLPAPPPKPK